MPKINKLPWDTNFFSFDVGRLETKIIDIEDIEVIKSLILRSGFKLIYYSSNEPIDLNFLNSDGIETILVDKKTTYVKAVVDKGKFLSKPYPHPYPDPKLIDLALQSGQFSRFRVDKRIQESKFQKLYQLWIENSVKKKIAKEVLVIGDSTIKGFVTLGEKNGRADIGIIAVDRNERGKGIGKKLMADGERWFAAHNYQSIQVVTQGDNMPACRLYESLGYRVESVQYFYHIWVR